MWNAEMISPFLTVHRGCPTVELNKMTKKNRTTFEGKCQQQGQYLPNENQLNRWFKER